MTHSENYCSTLLHNMVYSVILYALFSFMNLIVDICPLYFLKFRRISLPFVALGKWLMWRRI